MEQKGFYQSAKYSLLEIFSNVQGQGTQFIEEKKNETSFVSQPYKKMNTFHEYIQYRLEPVAPTRTWLLQSTGSTPHKKLLRKSFFPKC